MKIKNWIKIDGLWTLSSPTITLPTEILDNPGIYLLSDKAFRVLIGMCIIAAEDPTGNWSLPDKEVIARRLRMKQKVLTKVINELDYFIQHDEGERK